MPTKNEIERAIDEHKEYVDNGYANWARPSSGSMQTAIAVMQDQIKEPTDEDVAEAIDVFKRDIRDAYGEGYTQGYFDCQANIDYPQDEAVQRAIQYLMARQNALEVYILNPDQNEVQALDLAITALRQMRTEPCWYCKGIESHSIKSVKTVTDEFDRELGAYDTPYNYCPNCGRKLEG